MPTSELRVPVYVLLGVLAIVYSLLAGTFRRYYLERDDPFHCVSMLNKGSWLDSQFRNWQPEGCMLRDYKDKELAACTTNETWVFIGDSVTRKLFYNAANAMDHSVPNASNSTAKHSDHTVETKSGTTLKFFWDPFLNSSHIMDYVGNTSISREASVLLLGSGLWYLRYNESGGIRAWEARMELILDTIATRANQNSPEYFILPVEDIVPAKLASDRAATMHHEDVDAMNMDMKHRIGILQPRTNVTISSPQVFNMMLDPSQTVDGLHFSDSLVKSQINLLLNRRCNHLRPPEYPYDSTCCRSYPMMSMTHIASLFLIFASGPIAWFCMKPAEHPFFLPPKSITPLTISLATALIYTADRTSFWLKEQKQFDVWSFTVLTLSALGVGLWTLKRSDKDLGFLNREQTDEWKGWMQIAILIYHYTGASKISGIYNPIRVLVASYLFMTGYGHTSFYMKKADFGLLRICQVMVRLNLYTLVLAYAMNTDYLFYYFSPLVSFWFLALYATMVIKSNYNDRTSFLVGKIIVSAMLTAWIMHEQWILTGLFDFLERVFAIHWPAKEWGFRVNLDIFMVHVGMLVAVAYSKIKERRLSDHPRWPIATKVTLAASSIIIVLYFIFELSQESKFTYNKWHPFIAFFPVIAFAILRNATPTLRSVSSDAFAFIGRCSLETFIIQYHLWLAADTKGILLVIPGTKWRPLNMIVTTILFIFVSDRVAKATGELTSWICKADKPKVANGLPLSVVRLPDQSSTGQETEAFLPGDRNEAQVHMSNNVSEAMPGPAHEGGGIRVSQFKATDYRIKIAIIVAAMWALNILW